jgi:hypothetical protein
VKKIKHIKLSEPEQRLQKAEIEDAKGGLAVLSDKRKRDRDAFYREPYGNEKDGRSQLVTADVKNYVHGSHPHQMKRFLATDQKVTYDGPDKMVAKALKVLVRNAIRDQGGFKFFNDALLDGSISRFGVAKIFWRRIWDEERRSAFAGDDGQGLTAEQVQQLSKNKRYRLVGVTEITGPTVVMEDPGEPEAGLPPAQFVIEQGKRYAVLVAHRPLKESGLVFDNLPPEEFLHVSSKKRMNDREGCGHIRPLKVGEILRMQEQLSTPDEPYFDPEPLRRALSENDTGSAAGDPTSIEQEARELEDLTSQAPAQDRGPAADSADQGEYNLRATRWVVEWYSWVVSGKKLIPAVTTWVGKLPCRCVENEEGIIPFPGWSPYPYPHKLIGGGIAQDHADEQEASTNLLRAFLDSVGFQIDRAWRADASVDPLGLMDLFPGKVVTGDTGSMEPLDVGAPDISILRAIELLKQMAEEKGPGNRMSQGSETPEASKTATWVTMSNRAALSKEDMISLAFAELFLVPAYNISAYLLKNNMEPTKVIVEGQEVELSQESLKGDYRARAEIGLDVDFDDRAYGKYAGLLQMALQVSKAYPALFPLEKVYALARRLLSAAGEQDPGELVAAPPEQLKGWFPGIEAFQPPPPAPGGPAGAGGGPAGLLGPGADDAGRDYSAGQDTSQPDELVFAG